MAKKLITATWDDAPHLSEEEKTSMFEALPPHQRDARSKGVPSLGAGAIYPVAESEIKIDPFEIPPWYEIGCGMDVGWNWTAAVWFARDPNTRIVYIFDVYKAGQREPSVHADAIRARGDWIPVAIDPASRGRGQRDGEQLYQDYFDLGLDLVKADNSREAGIYKVWQMLSSGRLKIFKTCRAWFEEYRLYHRDEKGQIVKEHDHCLHGDTKVLIRNEGRPRYVRIKDLVGVKGEVLTVAGQWVPFKNCRMTGADQPTVDVEFDTGITVRCTPDHKFLTLDGWVAAIDMLDAISYNAISIGKLKGKTWWQIQQLYPTRFRNLQVLGTINAAITFSATVLDCIAKFGRQRTVMYLANIMYTISMKTKLTIDCLTWSLKRKHLTYQPINQGMAEPYLRRHLQQQRSGIEVKKAQPGIGSNMSGLKKSYISSMRKFVSGVMNPLRMLATQNFALISANLPIEERAVSIMLREPAVFAVKHLLSTSTNRRQLAAELALDYCKAVRKQVPSDVYCLEVPTTAAFAVSGGIVVHNCMDATRYGIVTGLDYALPKPGEDDEWDEISNSHGTRNSVTGY